MAIAHCHKCHTSFNDSQCPKCGVFGNINFDEDFPELAELAERHNLAFQRGEEMRARELADSLARNIEHQKWLRRPVEAWELEKMKESISWAKSFTRKATELAGIKKLLDAALLEIEAINQANKREKNEQVRANK
jgi:hypothetical protein